MKVSRMKIDLSDEKKLITNMIVSTEFLRKIHPLLDPKLMESQYSKILAGWIKEFFEYQKEAPGRAIQDVFHKKVQLVRDEDTRDSIADYLTHLSSEWERLQINNVDYSYKNGVEYLRIRAVERLRTQLETALNSKDPSSAESLIAQFQRLERPEGTGVHLLQDAFAIRTAFEQTDEIMFSMPGALGVAMGPICREDFIAVSGPAKRGKSWYMMDIGFRGALAGYKVLFVSLEMSVSQTVRRWWQTFNGKPAKTGTHTIPRFEEGEDGEYDILYEEKEIEGISSDIKEIQKKQERYTQVCGDGEVRLEIYPSGELTIGMLEDELDNMAFYENYIPDMIVLDYADILKVEGNKEKRHQLDDIWVKLRGMAQKRNVALVTGSQTGRDTSKKDAGADNFSEHFGKAAHITKGIFLNQTDQEKDMGIMRISSSVQRDGRAYTDQVVVLQGLGIGRPYLDSKFRSKVNVPDRGKEYGI